MRFNFGDSEFKFPPGYGYSGVAKAANLVPFAPQAPPPSAAGKNKSSRHLPMALILEPARELAQQTHDNITLFKKHLPPPGIKWVWTPFTIFIHLVGHIRCTLY